MARRLNTLLADLTVRPTAVMTTKDQLDPLFRAEIERMTAHLDDIAFAVRRSGAVDDVREMEADIEVGWAYRLIQLFGTTRALSFEAGCPGRSMLLRHGIPEPHVATIAETFRVEQAEARSSVFDRAVRQQMADVDLANTLAERTSPMMFGSTDLNELGEAAILQCIRQRGGLTSKHHVTNLEGYDCAACRMRSRVSGRS